MPVRLNTSFGIPRYVLGGTTPLQQGATGFGVPVNALGGLGLANQFGTPVGNVGLGGLGLANQFGTQLGNLGLANQFGVSPLAGAGRSNLSGLGGLNLGALSGFGLPLTNASLLTSLLAQASGQKTDVVQTTDGGISGTKVFV